MFIMGLKKRSKTEVNLTKKLNFIKKLIQPKRF